MKTLEEQLKETPAFRGEAGFLSNFSPYKEDEYMVYGGITYRSNEHFYQAMKFESPEIQQLIADHPFKGLKRFVRSLGPIREDWDRMKDNFMRIGLHHKFSLPRYRELLLGTGSLELVERNTWGDTYWGVYNDVGQNNLGLNLMQIRSNLQWVEEGHKRHWE